MSENMVPKDKILDPNRKDEKTSADQDGPMDRESAPYRLRAGEVCPQCRQGILDYDGLLNLTCPVCGLTEGGCFT